MNITTKDTNVIVLYGRDAVNHFSELVNCWTEMLSSSQWSSLQFILVSDEQPVLDLNAKAEQLVNEQNAILFHFDDKAPDASAYHSIVFDKVRTGNIWLHIICSAGNQDIRYDWLKTLVGSAKSLEAFTTECLYYLMMNRESVAEEREKMISLLDAYPGVTLLLGDSNENGGKVPESERWRATELAILLNCSGKLPMKLGAYSLGYSTLNANGSELTRLCQSEACSAMIDELEKPVKSLNQSDLQLELLPDGVPNEAAFREWIPEQVKKNTIKPSAIVMRNIWTTIRMSQDLSPVEAVKRMKRFADLNYAGSEQVLKDAKELAWSVQRSLRSKLRTNVITASLSADVLTSIAQQLKRMASENVAPGACNYPKKSLLMSFGKGKDEYLQSCKSEVTKVIFRYVEQKNCAIYAETLADTYISLAEWVRGITGDDENRNRLLAMDILSGMRKELDNADDGNTLQLRNKYKRFTAELENMHPSLGVLTEGITGEYFDDKGNAIEKTWRDHIVKAGKNIRRKMSQGYRGDFFRVLQTEFGTEDERQAFFTEYLKNGPRMYCNYSAMKDSGNSVFLVDDNLAEKWFLDHDVMEVDTDNAENLTVYRVGTEAASVYLQNKNIYFQGTSSAVQGRHNLFGNSTPAKRGSLFQPKEKTPEPSGRSLFGNAPKTDDVLQTQAENKPLVKLEPDQDGNYYLYWDWNGNDKTATIIAKQYNEKIGKIAVPPVEKFNRSGDRINFSDEVMQGKTVPAGTIVITILDEQSNVLIENAEVQGRRDVVHYKVSPSKLELHTKHELHSAGSHIAEKLVLRTTDTDGHMTYFPLYAADAEKPYLYENMSISDGKVVEDPTAPSGSVFVIQC